MSAPTRSSHRRRAARLLAVSAIVFGVATLLLFVARPRSAAYVPGQEREQSVEITRHLERALPTAEPSAPSAPRLADATGPGQAPRRGAAAEASSGPVVFSDAAERAGLRFRHFQGRRSSQLPEDMGSGLAWGDYDDDGDPDLFVVNESGPLTLSEAEQRQSPARAALFRNNGDGTFTDVTAEAGLAVRGCGMGAAWGDYDGDGRLDLFVTRYGTNRLFHNEGRGRFKDVSDGMGVGQAQGFWTGVSWADYDRDGRLDLYVCGYVRYTWDADSAAQSSLQFQSVVPYTLNPSSYAPERNLLYHNEGRRFREVAVEAGVDNPTGRSLSAAWGDFDADGWPDLYVANDVSDNAFYYNLRNGRFRDISHSAWVADYRGAMGLGVGDWDSDGALDMFVTHWLAQENALYANRTQHMQVTPEAPLRFVDEADMRGLGQIALDVIGWGTGFFDFDNDGRLDLFAANGSTFQEPQDPTRLIPMRNFLFWNGGEGYYEVGARSGAPWGLPNVGRGASFADFDGDGDLDIALVVHGAPLRLLRNEGGHRRPWLRVILRGPRGGGGPGPRTTHYANGAVVRITTSAGSQMRVVGGQPSYLSQEPPGEVFFGLGEAQEVQGLEVLWPSGETQTLTGVAARSSVHLSEGAAPEIQEARR